MIVDASTCSWGAKEHFLTYQVSHALINKPFVTFCVVVITTVYFMEEFLGRNHSTKWVAAVAVFFSSQAMTVYKDSEFPAQVARILYLLEVGDQRFTCAQHCTGSHAYGAYHEGMKC